MKTNCEKLVMPALVALWITGCATAPIADDRTDVGGAVQEAPRAPHADANPGERAADPSPAPAERQDRVSLGSGTFVQAAGTGRQQAYADEDGVTLNFEQADLGEFLSVVFETIVGDNYYVDPQVRGSVTLHTSRPVTRESVMPIVESVLEGNGAAVIRDDGIYKIVPLANAETSAGAPGVGRWSGNRNGGFGVQVVPLEHVSAAEIVKIIAPFVPEGSAVRTDEVRNVLIISGPRYRIDELLATVRTFDVDWLSGMSFGMFQLEYADAQSMIEELEAIIGDSEQSPLSGIVRLLPIERLNAVLVIAHRPDHVSAVKGLIDELDWGMDGSAGQRLYIYELENGKAENIARSLQEIFVGSSAYADDAPGVFGQDVFRDAERLTRPVTPPGGMDGPTAAATDAGEGAPVPGIRNDIRIIADVDNNSILVLADQQSYRSIEAAIRRLDVSPRQVLIEATIAEVSLSNSLDYGVRWFLENSNTTRIGFNAPVPTEASGDGLALAFLDSDGDLSAFFDVLASESSVKFLSTPQVMVLDNQTATIRVGDQIPVTTRSSQSTTNPDAPIVTEVQFRDTGTLLTVTPRISAGGQVTLEISQEVSLPGSEPAVGGGGNVAIAQRTIDSSVIVQSGQTVVLGGLILENTNEGVSGIPGLMKLPLLGKLFSTTSEDVFRTELIVTISPTVVENERATRQVTEELRRRMRQASDYENRVKGARTSQ